MPDTFVVQRTQKIAAAPADVFEHVVDLGKWQAWSPWEELDPNMNKTYTGDPGTVGSHYAWSGNRKVGQGSMTITDIDAPNNVAIDLKFLKPFKAENKTELRVVADGDGSEVTWHMTGAVTMMTKIMGLFGKTMDKMVGPDFEKGLTSLKRVVEG